MISDAALARLERAARTPGLNDEQITVSSNDVFAAVREIRGLRRKEDVADKLTEALTVLGEALRGELT